MDMKEFDFVYSELHNQFNSSEHLAKCYKNDNVFAYKFDANLEYTDSIKCYNFIPIYDRWCLHCNKKNCRFRCMNCKSVYYCSLHCNKLSYNIHKTHCGRNLFTTCIGCGTDTQTDLIPCDKCPVKFCKKCIGNIQKPHKEYDCKNLATIFGL
jgi:hypothetical protein